MFEMFVSFSHRDRITINGSLAKPVSLERGCSQGCPLSPTLFALFIEPLAQAIREDGEITGILIRETEYKICLYTDDVLVTLTNPDSSLPKLMSCLKQFGYYSGYKLNLHKTQTILYNYSPQTRIQKLCSFKWENKNIKSLGVQMPKDLTSIYTTNYSPITKEIKADLKRWALLSLDMHNRIDIIKMNILPQLLFLFQSLSIEIPPKQFNEWRRLISGFTWKGQKPRVRFSTLQLPKEKGGMSLPCLEDYYKAAQLRYLVNWCNPHCMAKWKELDQSQLDIPLPSL